MAAGGGKEMEIAIKIAGKVESSFKNSLSQATKGLAGITRTAAAASKGTIKGMGAITKVVGGATAAAAAAVGALGVAAVNVGKEFETSMSQVAATMLIDKSTKKGQKAFETLENAARECGAITAFSATEAAEALNYLALAGYDADKAATALPTVLNLAGAGAMDLADASNMVTDAMSALGIEATEKNLTSFADNLAKTASKSNTSVSELGDAILTVGGTAKYLSGGTTELSTCIGLLADNGIHASEGGTKLRNMITSLTAPTDKAAAAMKKLGVSAFDSKGNMRSLQDICQDLNNATAGMSAKESSKVLSTIFNKTDLKAVNALLGTSTQRWDELSGAIENSSGACEQMYAIQLDNLEGDIDILKSGLSDLGISIYKDLNGPLREMTQLATNMVGELSEAYKSGGMEGMVGAIGGCMAEVVNTIADYAPQVVSMGVDLLENFIGGITENSETISDTATEMVSIFIDGIFTLAPRGILAGTDVILGFVQGITEQLPELLESGMEAVANLIEGITERLPEIAVTASEFVKTLESSVIKNAPKLIAAAGKLFSTLLEGLNAQLPQLINTGAQAIVNLVNGIIQRLPELTSTALTLIQTLVNSIGQNAPMLINAAIRLIGNLILGIISMLPQLIQMGIQLILSLVQGIIANLPLLLQMAVEIVTNLVTGIVQMLPMIIQGGIQLIISLIQGIIANLGNIIQAAVQIVMTLISGLISAIPQLWAAIPQLIFAIIDAIFSTDWIQVGADILGGIADGFMSGFTNLIDSVKGLWSSFTGWLFGDDDDAEAESSGESAATSYANGIAANQAASTDAVGSMVEASFNAVDYSTATEAGVAEANAYTTGLTDSMAGFTFDTSGIGVDTDAITANMQDAGTIGGEALTSSLGAYMDAYTIDTSGLTVDTTGLTNSITTAGKAEASTLAADSGEVTSAAVQMAADINTALDEGWTSAQSKSESAMNNLTNTVKAKAKEAVNAIKSAFENMVITIPKPSIPVINVSESSVAYGDDGSVSVPNFSVSWNALGGIFDQPTIFNTPAGMQGVGEAGPEAVLPLDTLWAKMKEILNEAIAASSGASLIDAFIEKLKGIGNGGGGQPELAGAGGPTIQYSPVYNLYGSAGKEEIAEADRMSQAEFNKLMKQYEKDQQRRRL